MRVCEYCPTAIETGQREIEREIFLVWGNLYAGRLIRSMLAALYAGFYSGALQGLSYLRLESRDMFKIMVG